MTIDQVLAAAKEAEDLRVSQAVKLYQGGAVPTDYMHSELLSKLRAAILSYGKAQRERCRVACREEQVDADATQAPDDIACNAACEHCQQAIRALGDA